MNKLEALFGGKVDKEDLSEGRKLIAFYGNPDTDAKLVLLAIGMGYSNKSHLLRKIVHDWLLQHDPIIPIASKIAQIRQSSQGQDMSMREFKNKIKKFLEQKKVGSDLIEEVLKTL